MRTKVLNTLHRERQHTPWRNGKSGACWATSSPIPARTIVKGDSLSASIAAASILAKVERDRYMTKQADLYPGYGFERNKGYGTKEHIDALIALGPCPLHRRSFIQKWL